ncbi:MAG: SAM-dependent DNA methyltransferase [Anaerolineae bacterium]|nr:SAM-dependent DNA methyltransferase [Anaerolineae bacterium]
MGWSSWANLDYFLTWLLFGFGCSTQKVLPTEPTSGASMRLYQYFNLGWVMAYPYDYFGDIMAECKMGRAAGFFPTPHSICELMIRITYCPTFDKDYRRTSVMEPCVGTGRMLLAASNYSMCLYGQDISATCVNATLVNGYFYAPWMVKRLPFWMIRLISLDLKGLMQMKLGCWIRVTLTARKKHVT